MKKKRNTPSLLEVGFLLIIIAVLALVVTSFLDESKTTTQVVAVKTSVKEVSVSAPKEVWERPEPVGTTIAMNLNNRDAFIASCYAKLDQNKNRNAN